MLTQEDFVAPNMSGEGNLHRSSWKAEAIRRGDLKISGPIPITEETPLSEDEEAAYAEKHHADMPPFTPDPPISPPPPPPQSAPQPQVLPNRQPSVHNGSQHTASDTVESHLSVRQANDEPERKISTPAPRETNETQRQSATDPVSYSTPSPFPSIPESSSKMTPSKKKRKSGLRNVFRKMFGRKSRDEEPEEEEDNVRRHTYHRSDPGILSTSPERPKEKPSTARISDIPVQEIKPVNPLGSHLPFPMNVNAPQEASPPHEYLTFDIPSPDLGRRRATLPSVLLSHSEAQALRGAIGGSVERLPTWDERLEVESLPSPQIGIALSSPPPPGAHSVQAKRRSRSAGALRDLAKARPSIERRRSAEIRYWRDSYQSGSIYSGGTRPQTAKTIDTVRTANTQETASRVPEPSSEPIESYRPNVEQHDQDISEIPIPVDSFHFGNLKSGFSDDEAELEPQPEVPSRSEKRLSIEERVRYLENNMRDIESSVRRISGRNNRQTIILENAPKGRRSRNRSSSATSDRQGSYHSSISAGPPSPTQPLSAVDEFPSSGNRQTVIHDAGAYPRPSTAQRNEVAEQLAAVQASLKHERSARKSLEAQVFNLQREVSNLQAILNKFLSQSPSYPTPSPDGIIASNEERLATPRAGPEYGLGFETGEKRRETMTSRFSQSESELGDKSLASSTDDVTSPETWMTPKEESGFGSGFFSKSKSRSNMNLASNDRKAVDDEMF